MTTTHRQPSPLAGNDHVVPGVDRIRTTNKMLHTVVGRKLRTQKDNPDYPQKNIHHLHPRTETSRRLVVEMSIKQQIQEC
jgi:hypothetical protein